ncbi:MAG TPA: DUF4339 domain-containing protein [Pirellulales bacterium]|jgi:hypothetical protein|nr:DUF4339 domain-containing protein [Pirellulales bacterium]
MGIKFLCPNGHKLHVKSFLMGKKAICPKCGARVVVPNESTLPGNDADPDDFGSSVAQVASQSALSLDQAPSESGLAAGTGKASASADPIAEDPTAVWYVRPPTGGQFGPASAEIMRAWLGEGRVGASSLVWRAGWPEWRAAASVFPELQAAVTSAPEPRTTPAPSNGAAVPMGSPTAAPSLPVGRAVSHVARYEPGTAESHADLPDLAKSIPAMPPVVRRRRGQDLSPMVSIVLLAIAVILVVILIVIVFNRSEEPADEGRDAKTATRQQERAVSLLV